MASAGASRDALGSLLNDLGGVEAAILGRPKTLVDMKRDTPGTIPQAAKTLQAAAPASLPRPAASQQSVIKPVNGEARADHFSGLSSKSTSGTAMSQLSQSRPKPATFPARGKNPAVACRADASTGVTAEDFDAVFGSPTTSGQVAQAATPAPSIADDPFAEFSAGSQPMPARNADMIIMFGGTGTPQSASQQPTPSVATAVDDLLGGFASPPPPAPARSTSVVSQTSVQSDSSSEFGEFHHSHSRQQRQRQAAPYAATAPRSRPLAENVAAPSQPAQSTPPGMVDRIGWGQAAEGSRTGASLPSPSSPRPHRVFDYLDARESRDADATRPSSAGGAAPLDHDPAKRPHTAEHPTEAVAEMGQRAAKAFTSGTKWFMQKSRQLAKDVQATIEKARHQPPHGRSSSNGSGGASSPKAYYYDWAGQLARLSPGTRAAALGAMGEDDRLHVQRILDEAELGEAELDGTSGGLSGGGVGGRWREGSNPPPPPAYEDVVMEQAARGTARKMPAPPQPAVDLLRMDSGHPDFRPTVVSPAVQSSAAPMATAEGDLLGMGGKSQAASGGAPSSQHTTAHIDAMFTVGASRLAQQRAAPAPPLRQPATAATTASRGGQGLDSMINVGSALPQVDTTGFSQLYEDGGDADGAADEPEIRKVLRQRRVQEKHERMQRQLGEARARDEAAEAERSGKVELRVALRPRIDAWSAGKKDNIRALLSTLHVVLWEGSGWVQPSMADIVDPGKVKRWYMKANLVVHPDKVKQKGGNLEQVATADMVFDVLKSAWGKFEASN